VLSPGDVASTDRSLRYLARDRPDVAEALVRRLLPHVLRSAEPLSPEAVDDPHLDAPPPIEADLVARSGDDALLHVEFQGYRDTRFVDRLFRYHLSLVLRYPERQVTTVAVWTVRPPPSQRVDLIQRGSVTLRVASVVLGEVPASLLLADPRTACFAAGAASEGWSSAELCTLVVRALADIDAPHSLRHAAVALAAASGRYHAMNQAMKAAKMETPILVDLVDIGYDLAGVDYEKGREEGFEQGVTRGILKERRSALLAMLKLRGFTVSPEQCARIESEDDLERLASWQERVAAADSVDALFDD